MALKRIVLRDFVIVQALDLEFSAGFSVLTGETGAGKSILIDALQMALGERADTSVVREGANSADICLEFDSVVALEPWLTEAGFPLEDILLIRRVIDVQGRSRAWINGIPATATQLRAAADYLVDIHGQHAWQSLTRADSARDLLDAYASINVQDLAQQWKTWRSARQAVNQAQASQEHLQQERERLQWQINELEKLSPLAGEWEELNVQHTRLSHAQALLETAETALQFLEDDDLGLLRPLSRAIGMLRGKEHLDADFAEVADVLAASEAQIQDARHSLQSYLRHTELDPERLAQLDTRLASWMQLAKRYKRLPDELPELLAGWRLELQALDAAVDLEGLQDIEAKAYQQYLDGAREISMQRKIAAPRLAREITQAMQGLGMQGGQFDISFQPLDEPASSGLDAIELLVAGHPGVSPKPLAKVASGGELSRLALAIAVTSSTLGSAGSLIFDEVDSGIGGAVADTVGRLLHALGRNRQVLAVTHLPQVAANADQHIQVSKMRSKDSTVSVVKQLDASERELELARMLGGEKLSQVTVAHAREMLAYAAQGHLKPASGRSPKLSPARAKTVVRSSVPSSGRES